MQKANDKITMNYIIFDLEWNQPYSRKQQAVLPDGSRMPFEIFQIGALKLDENLETVDTFRAIIRLECYKKLHYMVKKITGMTEADIAKGISFHEALERFRIWCGEDAVLLTWGYDDSPVLRQNLQFHQMNTSWCDRWYNLQVIFNQAFDLGKNQRSLEFALDYLGIVPQQRLHDALNDAYYTAKVASKIDLSAGIKAYEQSIWVMRPKKVHELKHFGIFPTRKDALSHPEIGQIHCPICGELLAEKVRWKSARYEYRATVTCEKHGEFLCTLRLGKRKNGFNATRTISNQRPKPEETKNQSSALSTDTQNSAPEPAVYAQAGAKE